MQIFTLGLLNGVIFALYCYIVCYIILRKKQLNIKKSLIAIILFFITYYYIICLLNSIYAILFSGLCIFMFIKIIFEESIFMSLLLSAIIHIIKYTYKYILLFFIHNEKLLLTNTYKSLDWNAFLINLIVLTISTITVFLFRKKIKKIIQSISTMRNRNYILIIIIYLYFILTIIYQPPEDINSIKTFTDFLMIFVVTGIGICNVSNEMKMETLNHHYQEIFDYSQANGKLLSKYKMQVHEHKNRLLMIKGMLDGPKQEIEKYINTLLEEIKDNKSISNYWLYELRYIPIPGVRNFINYKLNSLKDLGTEIEVFVSSELEKIDKDSLKEYEYNQLATILGVILDNMIESIKVTDKKLASVNIYIEDNKVHCEFVNSFSGTIDLNRLNEVGYTTKGEQHGVGLPLVAKIIKSNDRFECKPQIIDNFFIQHLTIKILNKQNMQKISKK